MMAWKDEIQEEANKVANASWASTLRDSMYTSLTKLANFYETILVELTPKIEEKAEAKTLEILGGANSESVAAEVVLAREDFATLDARLDDIDGRIETNANDLIKVNRARRDILFNSISSQGGTNTTLVGESNKVVSSVLKLPAEVSTVAFYDEYYVFYKEEGIGAEEGRGVAHIMEYDTYWKLGCTDDRVDDINISTQNRVFLRCQRSIATGTAPKIYKVIGIKY